MVAGRRSANLGCRQLNPDAVTKIISVAATDSAPYANRIELTPRTQPKIARQPVSDSRGPRVLSKIEYTSRGGSAISSIPCKQVSKSETLPPQGPHSAHESTYAGYSATL